MLGAAFPASTFVGIDIDAAAIERGREAVAERGLSNVKLRVADAELIDDEESFDAVLVFNAIHDQAAPDAVLRNIHRALGPGGTFLMNEPRISSVLAENIDNPVAAFTYAVSVLLCMTTSLAADGAGLGTGWGEQVARRMLADAGFVDIAVHDAPGDPGNAIFVATRP
ncbi:MAG: class I SAM-dependent methyltransferase [Micromonosporaceae bacterium]|nr:class I SAM-dependent methyltransferase [Micromonosporaceae bacterium]